MGRLNRIINFDVVAANTWYKAYDVEDYKNNPIQEIKVKLRESSNADHFRYAYVATPTTYMTSSAGFFTLRDVKQLYVYVPDDAGEVIEIEIVYR